MKRLFDDLERKDNLSDPSSFSYDLAHLVCELYVINPFRVGSYAAIMVLANVIAMINGKYLDFSKASESLTDVALGHGVSGDYLPMKEIFDEITEEY